jgi:hypothetical protein
MRYSPGCAEQSVERPSKSRAMQMQGRLRGISSDDKTRRLPNWHSRPATAHDECQPVKPSPRRRTRTAPRSKRRETTSTADHRGQSLGLDSPPSILVVDSPSVILVVDSPSGILGVDSPTLILGVESLSFILGWTHLPDGLGWTYGPTAARGLTVRRLRTEVLHPARTAHSSACPPIAANSQPLLSPHRANARVASRGQQAHATDTA